MIAEIEEKEARKPLFAVGSLSQKRLLYERVISINGKIILKKSENARESKYTSFSEKEKKNGCAQSPSFLIVIYLSLIKRKRIPLLFL